MTDPGLDFILGLISTAIGILAVLSFYVGRREVEKMKEEKMRDKTGINSLMVTSGSYNTAIGIGDLGDGVTGMHNIAVGPNYLKDTPGMSYTPGPGYRTRPFRSSFRPRQDPLKNTDKNRLSEFEEVKKLDEEIRKFD